MILRPWYRSFIAHGALLGLMLSLLGFLVACGGGGGTTPYLVDESFEMSHECTKEFHEEVGDCVTLLGGGVVAPVCLLSEDDCAEHFYITKTNGRPTFVHVNAPFPCYSSWVADTFADEDSDFYQHGNYQVVAMTLDGYVTNDEVHIRERTAREDLQTDEICYYRLESTIRYLPEGSYTLKVWDDNRELVLQADFQKNPIGDNDPPFFFFH